MLDYYLTRQRSSPYHWQTSVISTWILADVLGEVKEFLHLTGENVVLLVNTSISVYTDPVSGNFLFPFQLHISLFTRYRFFMTGFPDSSIRSNLLLCITILSSNTSQSALYSFQLCLWGGLTQSEFWGLSCYVTLIQES